MQYSRLAAPYLTGRQAFRRVAAFIGDRLVDAPGERLVIVVSAENGTTDALLATATEIVSEPDRSTMDLLWSTGETHAVALLTLHLQARGIRAVAANIHQTGLVAAECAQEPGRSSVRPSQLLALLDEYDVVVAPGFLARGAGDRIVSLGRGGSDLTAVLLATGLGASCCQLVKDVPGYFTADPKRDPDARPLPAVSYAEALTMADAGCQLVQRHALVAARDRALPLLIRALNSPDTTLVT